MQQNQIIPEERSKEKFLILKELERKSKEDPNSLKEYKRFEKAFLQELSFLVKCNIAKYKHFNNYEDLYQEGMEFLWKGLKTYNPEKGSLYYWLNAYTKTRIARKARDHSAIKTPLKKSKQKAVQLSESASTYLINKMQTNDLNEEIEYRDIGRKIKRRVDCLTDNDLFHLSLYINTNNEGNYSATRAHNILNDIKKSL